MTIDEEIEKFKFIASSDNPCPRYCMLPCDKCVDESKQLAQWLEELKAYIEIGTVEECRNSVLDIPKAYNNGIDDFVRFANTMPTVEEEDGTARPMWLEEIAEQLKVGDAK